MLEVSVYVQLGKLKVRNISPRNFKTSESLLQFAVKNIPPRHSNIYDLFCSFPGSEVTKGVEDSIAGTGRLKEEASILGQHQYLLAGDG